MKPMMRYPGGDLAILGVEAYPDPLAQARARSRLTRQSRSTVTSQRPEEGGPRKRPRLQEEEVGTREKDETKRARGRPRLDVNDKTAADRRRTQIRLAQRAYRNRKETTVQTLEKQVESLRQVNREMRNAFMEFHDFAVASGLLDNSTELGRQLLAAKKRFITITQASGDDIDADDHHEEGWRRGSTSTTESIGSHRRRKEPLQPESQRNSPEYAMEPSATESPPQLYPGLTITDEPISQSNLTTAPATDLSLSIPTTSHAAEFLPTTTAPSISKAFDFATIDFDLDFLTQQSLAQLHPPIPSPYSSLPSPLSYASHETTFGRRYQRFAVERAHMLVTMPNPPLDQLNRTFGFCFLFESPDMIFQRTCRAIARRAGESLYNWQYPFYHLGGAGTHNFHQSGPGGPLNSTLASEAGTRMPLGLQVGNQGTIDLLKPHAELTAGFAMGPFPPAVNSARDNFLDKEMKMYLPGFEGTYYDCDEVEFYFHQRGVVIPPGADSYTVEIYPAQFGVGGSGGEGPGGPPGSGSGPLKELDLAYLDSLGGQNCDPPTTAAYVESLPSSMDFSSNSIISDDLPLFGYQQQQQQQHCTTTTTNKPLSTGAPQQANDSFDFSEVSPDNNSNNMFNLSSRSSESSSRSATENTTTITTTTNTTTSFDQPLPVPPKQPQQMWNQRMLVTIDVNQLVNELTERAICLGRTPGIRVEEINAAFWKSLSMAVTL
ncbi:hypothetical protein NEUTE1DRAFT_148609 [Neurospora tetrasperma FGSC 2508]|uniref:BZIP domain-containing protein n=1 Tax=Neurospora tetrasperma (strain FGSC 2508 / ATCC MYA-4615 / P0657) TaxID=510951 RepID=F8MWT8_NEUT8|nr:uncharacterized protein NEUTE1DRAFT_148609 [Neurospora tetrasperma FGSC 2508]EGO54209.1 hypothetical protein NEUTE1DRAFT_148609 [Neurospora tetrasperma FGSC 2508]